MSNDTNFHLHSAGWRIARNMGEGSSETGIAAAVPACLLLPLPPPRGSRYSGCVCEGCGSREWGVRKWESIYYTKHLPTALGVVQALLPLLAAAWKPEETCSLAEMPHTQMPLLRREVAPCLGSALAPTFIAIKP